MLDDRWIRRWHVEVPLRVIVHSNCFLSEHFQKCDGGTEYIRGHHASIRDGTTTENSVDLFSVFCKHLIIHDFRVYALHLIRENKLLVVPLGR